MKKICRRLISIIIKAFGELFIIYVGVALAITILTEMKVIEWFLAIIYLIVGIGLREFGDWIKKGRLS